MSDDTETTKNIQDITVEVTSVAEKKKSSLKLILMIIIPLLLIAGVVVMLFFTSFGHKLLHKETKDGEAKELSPHDLTYYPMPEILVNLNNPEKKRSNFLRIVVKLELSDPEAVKTLDLIKPRILDSFQVYLRELRTEDLQGSAGIQRLREELLKRVNAVANPVKARDILFETMLIQ